MPDTAAGPPAAAAGEEGPSRKRRSLSPWLAVLDSQLHTIATDTSNQQTCIKALEDAVVSIKKQISNRKKNPKKAGASNREQQLTETIEELRTQLNTKAPPAEVSALEQSLAEAYSFIARQQAMIENLETDLGSMQARNDMLLGMINSRI